MRILHILCFLVGVQLMINGVFFSSSLLTSVGAALMCFFILIAAKRPGQAHSNHGSDIGPKYHHLWSGKETYFAPLALLSLIGGCLGYLFLPIENVYEKTAITLAGTGLLYLLLVIFVHGRRATWKQNILTMLFGGLFVLWIGASIALRRWPISTNASTLVSTISTEVKSRFVVQTVSDEDNHTENGSWNSALNETGSIVSSWASVTGNSNEVVWDSGTTSSDMSGKNRDVPMTFGELVPYVVYKYGLSANGKADVAFTYLSKSDSRYWAFKAAYYDKFIGRTVNPDKLVKCDNYVVFLWLAENRPVSYTAENVYTVFWEEATKRWALGWCKPGAYVKWTNLY